MKLKLEIVTAQKVVFSDEVDSITLPTTSGEVTILPQHENLVSQIGTGEMRIKKQGKEIPFALTGGFLEVAGDSVTVLAEHAIAADDIQIAKAKEAQERAKKRLEDKLTDNDFRLAQGELRKALIELKVAVKYKGR